MLESNRQPGEMTQVDYCWFPFFGAAIFIACITLCYYIGAIGALSFLVLGGPFLYLWKKRIDELRIEQRGPVHSRTAGLGQPVYAEAHAQVRDVEATGVNAGYVDETQNQPQPHNPKGPVQAASVWA